MFQQFKQFQRLQQFAAAPEPEVPVSYPHTRLKELVQSWPEKGSQDPEEALNAALELRDYVLTFQEQAEQAQAQQGADAPADSVYAGIRRAIKLHLEACELLIVAIEEDRMEEDCPQVLALASEGDRVSAKADEDATRYRSQSGITG